MPESPKPTATPDPFAGLVRGRIVLYTPTLTEQRQARDPGPWASMVTNVGPQPGQVSLNVNLPSPLTIGTDPVQRRTEVPYSASAELGTWAWPPRA